jgi:hypothetical protein
MAPKKPDTAVAPNIAKVETITGFDPKETKLLAAAFVASIGPGKVSPVRSNLPTIAYRTNSLQYDWELMAKLSGNTVGSLKKMLPPVRNKAAEAHPSFADFIKAPGDGPTTKPAPAKANGTKKRKAAEPVDDEENQDGEAVASDGKEEAAPKAKSASAKANGTKKRKAATPADDEEGQDGEAVASDGKEEAAPKPKPKARGRPKKAKADKEADGGDAG